MNEEEPRIEDINDILIPRIWTDQGNYALGKIRYVTPEDVEDADSEAHICVYKKITREYW